MESRAVVIGGDRLMSAACSCHAPTSSVQDAFGGLETSVYDAVNRLTTREYTRTSTALREDFTYTARNQLATETRYSDIVGTTTVGSSAFTYDGTGRVTNINHKDGSNVSFANFTYTYDLADRVLTETTNGTATGTYTYDATNQLTNDGATTFTYDLNGNRQTAGGITYTPGSNNQIASDGVSSYTYDFEGNLTKKVRISDGQTWTYGYDERNQMVFAEQRVTDGGTLMQRVDFSYDVMGNRLAEVVTAGSTTTQKFAYDGVNVWADLDAGGSLTTRRVFGDQADEVLARASVSGVVAWYLTDRLGSVREMVDGSGVAQYTVNYGGFGETQSETGAAFGDRVKFTSREYDSATGLYYYRARYYDPMTGKFTSEDSVDTDPNLYRYVRNNPTNNTDPSGLEPVYVDGVQQKSWYEYSPNGTPNLKDTNAKYRTQSSVLVMNGRGGWVAAQPELAEAVTGALIRKGGEQVGIGSAPYNLKYTNAYIEGPYREVSKNEVFPEEYDNFRRQVDTLYFKYDENLDAWYQVEYGTNKDRSRTPSNTTVHPSQFVQPPPSNAQLIQLVKALIESKRIPGIPEDIDDYKRGYLAGLYQATNGDLKAMQTFDLSFITGPLGAARRVAQEKTDLGGMYVRAMLDGDIETVKCSAWSQWKTAVINTEADFRFGAAKAVSRVDDWTIGYRDAITHYQGVKAAAVITAIKGMTDAGKILAELKKDPQLAQQGEAKLKDVSERYAKAKTADEQKRILDELNKLHAPNRTMNVGVAKPPNTGGTPNSVHVRTTKDNQMAVQSTIYDSQGKAIGHIDWKDNEAHIFSTPGQPGTGHVKGQPHKIPLNDPQIPEDWKQLPAGVIPATRGSK